MKNVLNNKYLLFVLRATLAFVFIYAAILKIAEPGDFSQAIANYKLLPDISINVFGIILPWIEISAGILLLFGVAVKENSVIISGMLIVFIIAIAISLARGLNIDCGCFGTANGDQIGLIKLLQNIGLLVIGIILIIYNSTFFPMNKTEQIESAN
jgi:uncharacterized membrane protein YphA (DoxX/SURF4 family)